MTERNEALPAAATVARWRMGAGLFQQSLLGSRGDASGPARSTPDGMTGNRPYGDRVRPLAASRWDLRRHAGNQAVCSQRPMSRGLAPSSTPPLDWRQPRRKVSICPLIHPLPVMSRPLFRPRRQTSEPSLKERAKLAAMAGLNASLAGFGVGSSKNAHNSECVPLTRENLDAHTRLLPPVNPESTFDRCMRYVREVHQIGQQEMDSATGTGTKLHRKHHNGAGEDGDGEAKGKGKDLHLRLRRWGSGSRKTKKTKGSKTKKARNKPPPLQLHASAPMAPTPTASRADHEDKPVDGTLRGNENGVIEGVPSPGAPESPTGSRPIISRRHTTFPSASWSHNTWSQSAFRQWNHFWQELKDELRDAAHGGADGLMNLRRKGGDTRRWNPFAHDKDALGPVGGCNVTDVEMTPSEARRRRSADVMLGRSGGNMPLLDMTSVAPVGVSTAATTAGRPTDIEQRSTYPLAIPQPRDAALFGRRRDGAQDSDGNDYDDDDDVVDELTSGPLSPRTTQAVFGDLPHSSLPDSSASVSNRYSRQQRHVSSGAGVSQHTRRLSQSSRSLEGDETERSASDGTSSSASSSSSSSPSSSSSSPYSAALTGSLSAGPPPQRTGHSRTALVDEHDQQQPERAVGDSSSERSLSAGLDACGRIHASNAGLDVTADSHPTTDMAEDIAIADVAMMHASSTDISSKRRGSQQRLRQMARKMGGVFRRKRHDHRHGAEGHEDKNADGEDQESSEEGLSDVEQQQQQQQHGCDVEMHGPADGTATACECEPRVSSPPLPHTATVSSGRVVGPTGLTADSGRHLSQGRGGTTVAAGIPVTPTLSNVTESSQRQQHQQHSERPRFTYPSRRNSTSDTEKASWLSRVGIGIGGSQRQQHDSAKEERRRDRGHRGHHHRDSSVGQPPTQASSVSGDQLWGVKV
ncbi:hypothetical protein THASP1DRAFT_21541 [Thamnocephalis sphaerospora]|uniref:Uncharacterized protein n=1 Tax=Thamnocephalis sphaerospora TaxID=78915 RepID=A0A4P9XZ81_9FUNG|nr:hypothetical protein THASP1DRAFT_21541 [Thamnocephalis sphaerospora]|eukprot:RKP10770.1 hypothetical protein THASP1DRAFT_21541 [Thamnocephalis sphaerospora]